MLLETTVFVYWDIPVSGLEPQPHCVIYRIMSKAIISHCALDGICPYYYITYILITFVDISDWNSNKSKIYVTYKRACFVYGTKCTILVFTLVIVFSAEVSSPTRVVRLLEDQHWRWTVLKLNYENSERKGWREYRYSIIYKFV